MDNYFILLELPFDPPEHNAETINAAITKKQAQWSRDMTSNPAKKAKASECLAQLEDIKRVMLNPVSRRQEAEKAKRIKSGKQRELEAKLKLYRAKGDMLSDKDLKQLVKTFGPFGFTAEEIKSKFSTGAQREEQINLSDLPDKTQVRNIKNFMQQLDMKDKTLYNFLQCSPSDTCGKLCAAADTIKKTILAKGEKSGRDNAMQSLCGLCAVVFKDAASKQKYDNYVALTRCGAINDAIDELALGNQKRIEPKMKESLIDIAVSQYRMGVSEASAYIQNYCAYMGYVLSEQKIVCGLCGTENPSGMTTCMKCGKPLVILCPVCGGENSNIAKTCVKCAFDLTKMDRALDLLRQARQHYASNDLKQAEHLVKQAEVFWPNHPEIQTLKKVILDARQNAAGIIAEIMGDIQERRFYAAQMKLFQANAGGIPVDPSISHQVSSVLKEVEFHLPRLRSASGEEEFAIATQLAGIVSDSELVQQSLKKFPPDQVPRLTGRKTGETLSLAWESCPSKGDIIYRLVRKEQFRPDGPEDGTVLYSGKNLTFADHDIPENVELYYAVFAVRFGVCSKAAHLDQEVFLVGNVTDLKAVGGDRVVTLSWSHDPSVTEVQVRKYCGEKRPQDDRQFEPVADIGLDGCTVSALKNETSYWFAVSAGQMRNGKTYYSDWTYVRAVTQKPAKPLQNVSVQVVNGTFRAKWTRHEWDAILLYSDRKPEYAVGVIYDLDELQTKYHKINVIPKKNTEIEFTLDHFGECYIIPGIIQNSNVILSMAVPCYVERPFDSGNAEDIFRMCGKMSQPAREFEAITYRLEEARTELKQAKESIIGAWAWPIVIGGMGTVVLAIPFVVLFLIVCNIKTNPEGIKWITLYSQWCGQLWLMEVIGGWIGGLFSWLGTLAEGSLIWGLVSIVATFVLSGITLLITYVIAPSVIFLLPAMVVIGIFIAIYSAGKAKKTVPQKEKLVAELEDESAIYLERLKPVRDALPPDYQTSQALAYFYHCYVNGSVETVQEAINAYEIYRRIEEQKKTEET